MNRTTKWTFLVACLCCGLKGKAQEQKAGKWTPKLGMELTSELQGAHAGNYRSATSGDACLSKNYVNLLRLNATLPIVLPKSQSPRATGLTFEIASLSTCMTAKESVGGDLQTFSNLDAGNIPFALSVCNLVLNVGDRHSLSLGIRNMNEDYFCSPVTSFFTNSSCGIYPTISANYPIANYPVASMGIHYRYDGSWTRKAYQGPSATSSPTDEDEDRHFAIQASLYNGTGYNRFTGRDNVFRVCPKSDGLFGLAEVAYNRNRSSYFVGSSVYWGSSSNNVKGVSLAPWAYTEQRITDHLSLIAGYSHAFGRDAACRDFACLGGRYAWEHAELGLFTDYARYTEAGEFATELTCKVSLTPQLYLQPTVHAILMPHLTAGSAPTRTDLFQCAGTLRLGVTF